MGLGNLKLLPRILELLDTHGEMSGSIIAESFIGDGHPRKNVMGYLSTFHKNGHLGRRRVKNGKYVEYLYRRPGAEALGPDYSPVRRKTKFCLSCQQDRPFKKFNSCKSSLDGKQPFCKFCWETKPRTGLVTLGQKVCPSCGEDKPRTEYKVVVTKERTYIYDVCNKCETQHNMQWYWKARENQIGTSRPKTCIMCQSEKKETDFNASCGNEDGRTLYCTECSLKYPLEELIILGTKTCTQCGEEKNRSEFLLLYRGSDRRAQLAPMCHVCRREETKRNSKISFRKSKEAVDESYVLHLLRQRTGLAWGEIRKLPNYQDLADLQRSRIIIERAIEKKRNDE